ncbi:MAG TPA: YggT family protein [Ktedonosporobacter sp.]|nr:YggT family protein [Ktedonosporobacter sp.]
MNNPVDPRAPGYPAPDDPTLPTRDPRVAYSQSQREQIVTPTGQVEDRTDYVEDPNLERANNRYWLATMTYFVLGVLEVILLLRFVFRLLAANQGSSFVQFLYNLSSVFVAPFIGIFGNPSPGGGSVFETTTLIAMLVYALIGWGIASLGRVLFPPTVSSSQRVTTTRRGRSM